MTRRWLKRWTPKPEQLKKYKALRHFGHTLFHPSLWRFSRDPISKGMAIGLFWAVVPIPLQMVPASLFAIRFRANLPLAVALVLLTNPLTVAPIYYGNWKLGCFLLGTHGNMAFSLSPQALWQNFWQLGAPLLAGSIAAGLVLALVGYASVRAFWTVSTARRWKLRKRQRELKA